MKLIKTLGGSTKIENGKFLRWNIHPEIFLHKYYYCINWVVDVRLPYISLEYYMVGLKSVYESMFFLPKINNEILNNKHIILFPIDIKSIVIEDRIMLIDDKIQIESFSSKDVIERMKLSNLKKLLDFDVPFSEKSSVEEKLKITDSKIINRVFESFENASSRKND